MRAVQIGRFGGPEVFEIVEKNIPVPNPGQVRVRVHASGVNFFETLMRENRYAISPELPSIFGVEVAGMIDALGEGVEGPAVGTRVAVPLFAAGASGGYAEYVLAEAALVTPLPEPLSYEEATALMVQGLTALYLTRQSPPQGKVVVVSAAAGGVGSMLVQLARRAGAKTVIAAASTDAKLDFARSLGADACINYSKPGWVELVREASGGNGPDIIYESVGGEVTKASLDALAPLGELVVYGALNIQGFHLGVAELLGLIFRNQTVKGFALTTLLAPARLSADLTELFELAMHGQLKVTIGGRYPLEQVAEAHRAIEERRTIGKIVLQAS